MVTYTLKVIDVRQEASDVVTLCFKQPGLKKIKYQAGQYLTLIFRINGRRYIRPYSFSSAPIVDANLEVTVKRVKGGIVSNHIIDQVKVGDMIETMPPMGDFVFYPTQKKVVLWGVGSGITPLMSLTKYVLANELDTQVCLIYGNRSKETTIFYNTLCELQKQYAERFKVLHFHTTLSVTDTLPDIVQGRIAPQKAISLLGDENCKNALHYICGPIGLKESVKEVLSILNVPESNIFSEDFELVKNPADFEDIITRNVVLSFQNKEYNLEIAKGRSILEVALDNGIELPYSCQTGNCSTCKGKSKDGNLRMIGLAKPREDLKEDEYLLCCSHPLNDNVYIEI